MGGLLIRGGRVIDPSSGVDENMNILIRDGKIMEMRPVRGFYSNSNMIRDQGYANRIKGEPDTNNPDTNNIEEIDASGKVITPGLIDMHVHLREPGFEYKEDIKTGSEAAGSGGFTSIACMPNTLPVNDNRSVTDFILSRGKERGIVNIYPIAAITKGLKGEELSEIGELSEAGVIAISNDGGVMVKGGVMRRALEYARMFNLLVISHCEDTNLSAGGVMNEGFVSTELGLRGIPNVSEEIIVARDIALAELTGERLHIAHVSTAGSVRMIREAKGRGLNISCEVAPHHFTLSDEAVRGFDTNTKVNPPLRSEEDLDAIKEGLKDGIIEVIATDHAPHNIYEKEVEYNYAPFGIVGLETGLSLTLRLVHNGILSLMEAISKLTINPAKIMRLDTKGVLKIGGDADITIIDINREIIVDVSRFKSKSRNSPFNGWRLKGCVEKTIVGGKVVFSDTTSQN
ncbi:MAG: dihydroorotase [Nitrospinae bacterium]|nr:dihydroorotase [Nitrospinota bacterium]